MCRLRLTKEGKEWTGRYLRTISALGRLNEGLPQGFRQAVIFRSDEELKAAVRPPIDHRGLAGVSGECWLELTEGSPCCRLAIGGFAATRRTPRPT